jgi:UPF0271 protein
MVRIELNCDLGEGEPPSRTRAFMRLIDSANIACGGHAGDANSILRCLRLAKDFHVRVGAHPGVAQAAGRGPVSLDCDELQRLLVQQVGSLLTMATSLKLRLHHIKLHGSLYHATESSARLANCYVRTVATFWPKAEIYALAGGRVAARARDAGLIVREEAFSDRRYRSDGGLVPRGQSGAVFSSVKEIVAQARAIVAGKPVITETGDPMVVTAQTLCFHSDTPGALHALRQLSVER